MRALVHHGPGQRRLDDAMLAYDTFAAAGDTGALKVLISNG